MRHATNIESPINIGFESGLRVVEAHSQTAVGLTIFVLTPLDGIPNTAPEGNRLCGDLREIAANIVDIPVS